MPSPCARNSAGVAWTSAGSPASRDSAGHETERTLAPIGRWSALDVFAYLAAHDLPIHPAYAMSHGGLLERERLRVASIGGLRGAGMGRRQWELEYYPEIMTSLGKTEVIEG